MYRDDTPPDDRYFYKLCQACLAESEGETDEDDLPSVCSECESDDLVTCSNL